jgi:hypothetical protein
MKSVSHLVRALLGAALIIGASAAIVRLTPAYISPEMAQRLAGALLGAVVVVYANAIPKAISACIRNGRNAAQEQAARRFAGWVMVLGGLGYMAASLFAPIAIALTLAAGLLASALLAAVARCLKSPT